MPAWRRARGKRADDQIVSLPVPEVSVLLPVRNGEAFVRRAITSVLSQTFRNFELLILDDASTDCTPVILDSIRDTRLRRLRNDEPLGIAASLNRGLGAARGQFIARMDADDICHPRRLEWQVDFLARHPSVGLCGSWMTCFGAGRRFLLAYPTGPDCVRAYLLFDNPLAHPTVCWRASLSRERSWRYDERLRAAQDFDLWVRGAACTEIDNLPVSLLRYRLHEASVSHVSQAISDGQVTELLRQQLEKIGIHPDEQQLRFHRAVGHGAGQNSRSDLDRAERWLAFLLGANRGAAVFPEKGLAQAAGFVWWRVCLNSANLGPGTWWRWRRSALARHHAPLWREQAALLIRSHVLRGSRAPTGRLAVWDSPAAVE